eukprot:TRINITY_DN13978_c0_g1_i1.p1 TRINITY_DN13978_c0_g1~~TRINITY_DN13978_c0_g1_i1.p1  ORF type:complete len:408 (-),score=40.21 TRINITY_DN13978_c0_g1_i1:429-1652(-)
MAFCHFPSRLVLCHFALLWAFGACDDDAACSLGSEEASCASEEIASRPPSRKISAEHVLIQVRSASSQRSSKTVAPCCEACGGRPYCSPRSGGCYRRKRQDYYESCPVVPCEGSDCPMGWVAPGDRWSAEGEWCEVEQPPSSWNPLKTCPTGNTTTSVKVMTYNLFWWSLFDRRNGEGGRAGRKIASTNGPDGYDIIGFQECGDVHRVMNDARSHGLQEEYGTINGGRGLAMAYLKSRWTVLTSGGEDVGEDSRRQYYGKRAAHWARLRHSDGTVVFFINHHGPLPVSHGGGCTGSATAYNIMRLIAENAHAGDGIVLVGDFNAQKHSSRIQALDRHMHRIFSGSSHGGVDHIYSNCQGSAVVSAQNLGSGGSDHDALSAVLAIPRNGVLPSPSPKPTEEPCTATIS